MRKSKLKKPGLLQSMGLQRVRHDWATELNLTWVWVLVHHHSLVLWPRKVYIYLYLLLLIVNVDKHWCLRTVVRMKHTSVCNQAWLLYSSIRLTPASEKMWCLHFGCVTRSFSGPTCGLLGKIWLLVLSSLNLVPSNLIEKASVVLK